MQLQISASHVRRFRAIVQQYDDNTSFPKRGAWKRLTNEDLWLRLVGQVMVVGSSAGEERFMKRDDLKRLVSFRNLELMPNDAARHETLNYVMREAGVRYASKNLESCNKSCALLHNFKFIQNFDGGFKGLLIYLAGFKGRTAEIDRVHFLMKNLKYVKNKSARDFLIGVGLNRNTLALDIRIQNIFTHVGIAFPLQEELARKSIYAPVEQAIINRICTPLGIEPMKFDRILYQNYNSIIGRRTRAAVCED